MTLLLFEWSFFNNTVFMGIKIAAAAKAVAAMVEEISSVIAISVWIALVILTILMFVFFI